MDPYHLRREDKELGDGAAIDEVLHTARYVALAMCRDDEPYLVMLNHGYDAQRRRLYFHCAGKGKKLDFLSANTRVWGMAVDDLGYQDGHCDHAYRSVMFGGTVTLVSETSEKAAALEIMIRQQESNPERVMAEQLTEAQVGAVTIGRIDIEELSGKIALPKQEEVEK